MDSSIDGPKGTGAFARGLDKTVREAIGRADRDNPVLPRTGGPAGNALLTAWTGLVMLVLSVAELLTLFDVRGLISWHIAIGALLVPPALAKIASTGWRMLRYYSRDEDYQYAGPPPLPLRLLGPPLVLSTIGLLGSGVVLVLLGQDTAHHRLLSVLGFGLDWVGLHQGMFIVWAVAAGVHLVCRLVPALRITIGPRAESVGPVPARLLRGIWFVTMAATAVVLAALLVRADGSWSMRDFFAPGGSFPPPSG